MTLERGSVIQSLSGHDAGVFYMVTALEDGYVLLADGKNRPFARPKRKNLRHIRKTNTVLDFSSIQSDKDLRRLLAGCHPNEGGSCLV